MVIKDGFKTVRQMEQKQTVCARSNRNLATKLGRQMNQWKKPRNFENPNSAAIGL